MPVAKAFNKLALPKGIPLTPYPKFEKCSGLVGKDPKVEIKEGFLRIGYNFKVVAVHEKCFFELLEEDR
jgi:hypothetical protein